MKKFSSILLAFLLITSLLSGCSPMTLSEGVPSTASKTEGGSDSVRESGMPAEADFSKTDADMFSDRDGRESYDEKNAVTVKLQGNTAKASGSGVKITGSKVTITEEGTYVISGKLDDGMLVVNAADTAKLQLVFDGVQITSKTSAALYILGGDKVFLTLKDKTENTLANGGSFVAIDENNIDGALFSKQDLTLNGKGTLNVTSPAGHGIVCKDDLVITNGTFTVESASHGLDANDSVRIQNGSLSIDAGKDAIHCENNDDPTKGFVYISGGSIKAEAEGDGISAGAYLQIEEGKIDLAVGGGSENGEKEQSDFFGGFMGGGGKNPGGMRPGKVTKTASATSDGSSMKGLKAESGLLIADGEFNIDSADDAIHSNVSLIINGGDFTISSGDDALHAEESLTVTAGKIQITTCYEGLEALHVDVRGGDIKLKATDDGLNAAGGMDESGTAGGRDGMFGGGKGGFGRPGGSSNSNGSIKISGGTLYINSSGDGMDANGTLEISGGHITVTGPTQGDTATLDYDKTGVITGGTFIGTGSTMMAQSFSDSEQGVVAVNAGRNAAKTKIVLTDQSGKVIFSHEPELDFAVIILSSPDLEKGQTYSLTIGSKTMEVKAN